MLHGIDVGCLRMGTKILGWQQIFLNLRVFCFCFYPPPPQPSPYILLSCNAQKGNVVCINRNTAAEKTAYGCEFRFFSQSINQTWSLICDLSSRGSLGSLNSGWAASLSDAMPQQLQIYIKKYAQWLHTRSLQNAWKKSDIKKK